MPRQTHFNKTGLKARGWTETLIQRVLGATDCHHSRGSPQCPAGSLYLRERVEQAEADPRVKKAIERAGERFHQHQLLLRKLDRKLFWRPQGLADALLVSSDAAGPVKIAISRAVLSRPNENWRRRVLENAGGQATAFVSAEEFVHLVVGACEADEVAPVLDWLLEHETGDEEFRKTLARCAKLRADERRRPEQPFGGRTQFGGLTITTRYKGAGCVHIGFASDRDLTSVSVNDVTCICLARDCGTAPEALLNWLAEAGVGNDYFRATLASCLAAAPADLMPPS